MLTALRQRATVVFVCLAALAGLCIALGQDVPEWLAAALAGAAVGSAANKDKK